MNNEVAIELNEKLQTAQLMTNRAMEELNKGNKENASKFLSFTSGIFNSLSELVKNS